MDIKEKLKSININPISNEWEKRYASQPPNVQERLDQLNSMKPGEYQLKVIKRSRTKPVPGDIFVLSPREGIYFYGRVFETNIDHIYHDTFIHGKNVVFIFKSRTKVISLHQFEPDYDNLLISPEIVDASYWSRGYFFTIGNEPLNEEEKKLDYGFYDIANKMFINSNGTAVDHEPEIFGAYGIATIIGIARQIEKELIIDPTLLEL